MPGYFVWCGSLIEAEGQWHLFASRWPKDSGFPEGYRTHSEIVRAVAQKPEGPYRFAERVIGPRAGDFWDGRMAHNPKIIRSGGQFVLFYIGSDKDGKIGQRYTGYAVADKIGGPWRRADKPLSGLVQSKECPRCDATNPAPCPMTDGRLLLAYRQSPEVFHADYDEKDNLYRGGRWPYSSRTCVAKAGALVPAMQALKFRRNLMRSAKEGVVPPRAQRGPISMSC
jgi:hypothetical protein